MRLKEFLIDTGYDTPDIWHTVVPSPMQIAYGAATITGSIIKYK
jgi:hypothetical protein